MKTCLKTLTFTLNNLININSVFFLYKYDTDVNMLKIDI